MAQETLLGFPAHTFPYHRGGFTKLSIVLCLFGTYYGRKGAQPSSAILRPMRTPITEAIIKPRVQPELSPRQ